MKKKIILLFSTVFFFLICAIILALSIRGLNGNPSFSEMNSPKWKKNGPFELSPERGKYALTISIVENKSLQFSLPIAQFATPDLGYINGNYVSLFPPGVSYALIPGYIIGKYFGASQVGAVSIVALFALINASLIWVIARKLGINTPAAFLGAFVFLFADPAFPYAVTLYEHHFSTFIMLLSIFITISIKNPYLIMASISFLYALSIPVDNPNAIFMLPILIFAFGRVFYLKKEQSALTFNINILPVFLALTAVIPIGLFLLFNQRAYGNLFQLGGTVQAVKQLDSNGKPYSANKVTLENADVLLNQKKEKKSVVHFFNTRNLLNGLYIQILSPDRGIAWYSPIMFLGILGMFVLYKKNPKITALFLGITGTVLLLYTMWGDPYGGWAFGSRYLIPVYAVSSIWIAAAASKYSRKTVFVIIFLILMCYSVAVNTLGALTTNANPPKVEAVALEKISGYTEKYTYERNIDYLLHTGSKSFVWNSYFKNKISAVNYYIYITSALIFFGSTLLLLLALAKKGE